MTGDLELPSTPSGEPAGRRALSSALDQVMSSASNGLIVLAVARVASVDEFGVASLLFAVLAMVIGCGRGVFGTPIMLSAASGRRELGREAAFATTLVVGLGIGLLSLIGSAIVLVDLPPLVLIFGIAAPVALIVDIYRYTLISDSRPHLALLWDGVWAFGSFLLFLCAGFFSTWITELQIVGAWAILALVAAVGMAWNLQVIPAWRGLVLWWREQLGARFRYGVEAGLGQITVLIVTSIATVLVGISAAAALRGASTLMSPFAILLSALPLVVIPDAVRRGISVRGVWQKLCRVGTVASVVALFSGPAFAMLPSSVGTLILGDSWSYAKDLLPIISLEYSAMVWLAISMSLLRLENRSRSLLAIALTFSIFSILLSTGMAFLFQSAAAVAWGLVGSALLMAVVTAAYVRPRRRQ